MLKHNAFKEDSQEMSKNDLAIFYTKDGWLTEYALCCGYVERIDHNDQWLSLWKEGCYHVRWYNFETHKRICWESFDTLTEAREFFTEKARELEQM